MSNPNSTADDHRDRLVDRVLAEALGEERPPDLSQTIAQRVADAQAEVASTTQGRGVMQSRRVWITLLATAASLMAAAFVWQANERRQTVEVATVLVDRSQELKRVSPEGETQELLPQSSAQGSSSVLDSSKPATTQQSNAAGPTMYIGNAAPEVTVGLKEGWQIEVLDGPESGPSVADDQRRPYKTNALSDGSGSVVGSQLKAVPSARLPKGYASLEPQSDGVEPAIVSSESTPTPYDAAEDKRLPASPPASEDLDMPFRQGSITAQQPQFGGGPGTAVGGVYINDATVTPNGPFGFAGGGEAYPKSEAWRDLSSSRRSRFKEVDQLSRDRYEPLHENAFVKPVGEDALSTFSIDVDTASYANVRQYLRDLRQMPPADAVRIEELVNYFDYGYKVPEADGAEPFAANLGCSACPWKPEHKLVRIGVKGREVAVDKRPLSNLVFLIDVSGSMNEENKLPLVISGLNALVNNLGENDRVAIVVYAGSEGVVLPSTTGDQKNAIRAALDRLTAGGSTAGGAGLRLAYEIAERNKIVGGVNRVVLCTDGDFNVGMTGTEEIAQFVETRAKETNVYLTVLGFGRGNLNDAMLEQVSGRGDGNYAYIDDFKEAHRVLSSDLSKTLVAIAKDVKMQVEFNPAKVASYRLIGYENRVMAAEDFNNDAKDAGDIGAGHTVTALFEVVPVGVEEPAPAVDGLKYQQAAGSGQTAGKGEPGALATGGAAVEGDAARVELTAERVESTASADELLTLKIRYKQPEGGASKKLEFPLEESESGKSIADADADFRWAAAVAEFGMLLRNSRHVGDGSFDAVLELARGAIGDDPQGYRAEFVDLVRRAKEVSGR